MQDYQTLEQIKREVQKIMPSSANVSEIEFEGSEVAVYCRSIDVVVDDPSLVSTLAKSLRRRVVIRSDPSIRVDPNEAEGIVKAEIGDLAEISYIDFDHALGEVIVELDRPELFQTRNNEVASSILLKTGWRPHFYRTPPIESQMIKSIRHILFSETESRKKALKKIGHIINRPTFFREKVLRITALGGYLEVGRSSTLLQTGDANIIVDCGVNVGYDAPVQYLPRFDLPEFDINTLDAVVITHAHLDHSGFVPYLFKYGYRGPVYCTPPTLYLMTLLQLDYLDVAEAEGKLPPYSKSDIREAVLHTIPLNYGEVTDIAAGVKLTFHNAGHIVGSAIAHMHIGNGLHNIAFAHDFRFAKSRTLDRATHKFLRLETLVMESTYGNPKDVVPSRDESEKQLKEIIIKTINRGGKVLIPVLAVGRAQELMVIVEELISTKQIPEVPVFVDGMIREANAITTAFPEFLSKELQDRILQNQDNPFLAPFFHNISDSTTREEIVLGDPCIIFATSGMLAGGPSLQYFTAMAEDPKNSLVIVSYQGKGTLGRKVEDGIKEIKMKDNKGKTYLLKVNMEVHKISGFTGHSDRNELMEYVRRLVPRPKRFVMVHGEETKCKNLAKSVGKAVKRESLAPPIGTTICLT